MSTVRIAGSAAHASTIQRPSEVDDVSSGGITNANVKGSDVATAKSAATMGFFFGRIENLSFSSMNIEFFFNLQRKLFKKFFENLREMR